MRQHWRTNADPHNAKPLNATPLAEQVAQLFDRATAPDVSYHVTLADEAQLAYLGSIGAPLSPLAWTDAENGTRHTYIVDPHAGYTGMR